MGCDIHMYIEYKVGDDKWHAHPGHSLIVEDEGTEDEYSYVREVNATTRHYDLFARLAGVRGWGPDAKGVPNDVSERIRLAVDNWDCDGHSHSYMSIGEFKAILDDMGYEPTDRYDMFYDWNMPYDIRPPNYTTIINGCERHKADILGDYILLSDEENVPDVKHRLVFFFDN